MKLWGLLIGAALVAACGDAGGEEDLFGSKVCVPGATAECACAGGAKGAQACLRDGSGYDTCECGGGSGGSAGGNAGAGGAGMSGTGGSAGSCAPKNTCPLADPVSGTLMCGALDDGCGGKINCACEFGDCRMGACECRRTSEHDALCAKEYTSPLSFACGPDRTGSNAPAGCKYASPSRGFPVNSVCCAR